MTGKDLRFLQKSNRLKVLLVCLTLLASFAHAQVSVSLNGSTIINPAPAKYGINLGTETSYDSGQQFKNILINANDAGFEPYAARQIYQIQTGAAPLSTTQVNSNINNTQYDQVPANFWAGGTIQFISLGAAAGSDVICSSTITANTVAGSSPNGPVFTFAPACSTTPAVGNAFIVSKTVAPTAASTWGCSGSGSCSSNTTDLCPSCGTQTLAMDGTAGTVSHSWYVDNTAQDEFILVNGGTWTYSHWLKAVSGTPTISTSITRGGSNGFSCSWTDTPSTTWTLYTHTCTPTETGTGSPTSIQASWSTTGGKLYQDNVDFEQTSGNSSANTSTWRDAVVTTLQNWYQNSTGAATQGTCRYNPLPASSTLADLTLTSPFGHALTNPGLNYSGGGQYPGLLQFLQLAKVVGCQPLFIVPITFSSADAQGLIDYLGGGSGTAYGALRISQGQTAAWTSVFPNIYLEFGNENWNGIFVGEAIGFRSGATSFYSDYMQRAGTIFTAMRGQASFASNIKLVVGVQTAVTMSSTEAGYANPDLIEINGYTQTTVSDTSTTALLWSPAMTQAYSMTHDTANSDNFQQSYTAYNAMNVCGPSHAAACQSMVYEQNLSTDSGSITQATLDGFVDGGGTGIMTAQQFLQELQAGIPIQNLYALSQYYFYDNPLDAHIWGAVVDMGGSTNIVRPTFLGGQLANSAVIGPMFQATIAAPDTYNLPANNNGVHAISSVPYEFAYGFKQGNTRSVVLINTDLTTAHAVNFTGTDAPLSGSTVIQTQLAPAALNSVNEAANLAATNTTAATVALATSTLSGFNPASSFMLPAHSATVLSYSVAPASQVLKINGAVTLSGTITVQ